MIVKICLNFYKTDKLSYLGQTVFDHLYPKFTFGKLSYLIWVILVNANYYVPTAGLCSCVVLEYIFFHDNVQNILPIFIMFHFCQCS